MRRHRNEARVAAIYLVRRLTDQTVWAAAEQFGGASVAAISKVVQRAAPRSDDDPKWNSRQRSGFGRPEARFRSPGLSIVGVQLTRFTRQCSDKVAQQAKLAKFPIFMIVAGVNRD